jgi:hypothetical protein
MCCCVLSCSVLQLNTKTLVTILVLQLISSFLTLVSSLFLLPQLTSHHIVSYPIAPQFEFYYQEPFTSKADVANLRLIPQNTLHCTALHNTNCTAMSHFTAVHCAMFYTVHCTMLCCTAHRPLRCCALRYTCTLCDTHIN